MTIVEKRNLLMNYCKSHSCNECILDDKSQEWVKKCFRSECLDIYDSDEEDLNKAIKLIQESKKLDKAHDTDKLKETLIDSVNSPSHYTDGKIEVIDYIEDKKLGFCLGNAIEYISRAGKKDKTKESEDIKKAIWYLNRHIKNIEGVNND
jgi:hypothetical protein